MEIFKKFKRGFQTFDSADIITGIYALSNNMVDVFDTPESQLILDAIRRSTIDLEDDASVQEVANYIQSYDEEQILGIINNVKGIYHEMKYVYEENNDEDSIMAEMFEETNHPDSDVILIDSETGEREYVQLKATEDATYVKEAIEKNPHIRVISTEELAEKLGIESSGMSNEELNEEIENTIKELRDDKDLLDYVPKATFWAIAFTIFPIIQSYFKGKITKDQCIKQIAKITGYKTVRVIVLLTLMSFPISAVPTSIYLTMKYTTMVFRTFSNKN